MSVVEATTSHAHQEAPVSASEIWRLSVEQYHEMVRTGTLTEDDPVELLAGYLVTKMPKNPPHSLASGLTAETLARLVPPGWFINGQEPITTSDSEPEPDVSVIRGSRRDFTDRHPSPGDAGLVVEVSQATLARDRRLKKRVYAAAGVPTYWILNLEERSLEVYCDPTGPVGTPDYRSRVDHGPEDEAPVVLDGVEVGRVRVAELLP